MLNGGDSSSGTSFVSNLSINSSVGGTVGNFTVTGGVEGTDFSYDHTTGVLTILSDTDMCIEGGSDRESIVVDDSAGAANLALKNVHITSSVGSAFSTGNNDVYIELEGRNTLSSLFASITLDICAAGLNIGELGSVTINGGGSLTASSGGHGAAAIGSDRYGISGDITIDGGTIVADGGIQGTGIGSGDLGEVGNITINGGTITAIGGTGNAGIGSGAGATAGDITITGGTIVATGGASGAGIGSGGFSTVGNITITGGNVTATGGTATEILSSGAGIGSGQYGTVGNITYVEECVTAIAGGSDSENIGAEKDGTVGTITTVPFAEGDGSDESIGEIILQIGETSDDYNQLKVPIFNLHSSYLKIDDFDVSTQDRAQDCISKALSAVNQVSTNRSIYGALQNRLEHTASVLSIMKENIQDAESTIRDTDIAEEMMEYTKNNILIQSSQSMLAHASSQPEMVLQLLG